MPGFELAEWLPFGSLSISGVSVSSLGPSDLALMTTFLETFAPNAHPHRHPCRRVDDFSPRSRLARYPPWEPAPVARQHPVCQSPRRQECLLRTLGDASWHEASWDGVPVTLQDPVSASTLHGQWRCSVQRKRHPECLAHIWFSGSPDQLRRCVSQSDTVRLRCEERPRALQTNPQNPPMAQSPCGGRRPEHRRASTLEPTSYL